MRLSAIVGLTAMLTAPGGLAGDDAGLVVATRNVRLDTDTALFSIPVEALRGETWEVVKAGRKNVVLTFAPGDPRRQDADAIGLRANFRAPADVFAVAFVDAERWPEIRRGLAESLSSRLPDLMIEERERVVSGEVWVGMSRAAAAESVGSRVLARESTETETGCEETWRVGAFSLVGSASLAGAEHVAETNVATLVGDRAPALREKDALDGMVRIVLTFRDDRVTAIRRVEGQSVR